MRVAIQVLAAALAVSVCAAASADCTCAKIETAGTGWCEDCKAGLVHGVWLKSHKVYDAVQGVEVSKEKMAKSKCEGCTKAYAKGGTCEACHVTFVAGKMYKSPMAAKLAAGKPMDGKAKMCGHCKEKMEKADAKERAQMVGWCEECKAGVVKGVRYDSKESFEAAKEAHAVLTIAAKACEKCEGCGVAMVMDGKCEPCGVAFKDGKMAAKP